MTTNILVTGGAGYIGSFMVRVLLENGYQPIILDDLSRSDRSSVPRDVPFFQGKVSDKQLLTDIHQQFPLTGIIHFAGFISMKESMENPSLYFESNTFETLRLVENMRVLGITNIIFSSTAGVYGNPESSPVKEDDRKHPTNPYGESKLMAEKILDWNNRIYGLNFAVLRYFNACGAAMDGSLGEANITETHIIPIALDALKHDREFVIYGNDYSTPDGTCVRDYIHVLDLAMAHVLALKKIVESGGSHTYNVGTGKGYSNREIASTIEEVTGKKFQLREEERRPGDADILIADVTRIKDELNFVPKYSDIRSIIQSAWAWHKDRE